MANYLFILFNFLLTIVFLKTVFAEEISHRQAYYKTAYDYQFNLENEIRPFATDGCSIFPDGIPFINDRKWQHCCIEHDVSYWKGGTKEEKAKADQELYSCVAEAGLPSIGFLIKIGVTLGGTPNFFTTWRWGYGWIIPRGYGNLNASEQNKVNALSNQVEGLLTDIEEVQSPEQIDDKLSTLPRIESLTGDYCFDAIVDYISSRVGGSFQLSEEVKTHLVSVLSPPNIQKPRARQKSYRRFYEVNVKNYDEPFLFMFSSLQEDTCEPKNKPMHRNDISFRAQTPFPK